MRYGIRDLPWLLATRQGRKSLYLGQLSRLFPLFRLAAGLRRRLFLRRTRLIVVSGSLGKTTTAGAIARVLGLDAPPRLNADYALILNLLRISAGQPAAVMEVGIDRPGQMAPLARMIRPDTVVITSIAHEHILSFRDLEGVRMEKAEMVMALPRHGTAILNADDPNVMWMARKTPARVVTYGITNQADVRAEDIQPDFPDGIAFTVRIGLRSYPCRIRLLGRHMLYPCLAALAVAHVENADMPAACRGLEGMASADGRMQPVRLPSGALLIRDDFKSTRETIWAALDMIRDCPARRRILIMGMASEIPNEIRYSFHRELGRRIAGACDSAIILANREIFRSIRQGAAALGMDNGALSRLEGSPLEVIGMLPRDLGPGDLVLIKGRTDQRLARIGLALAGKTVGCRITECRLKTGFCSDCPWLETGPGGCREKP